MIRIIGGIFRGRKLKVPELADLRPTPDRVRETLFNWLAPYLPGAYCLDAFAGSGILGFEALSRGASQVVMVDASLTAVNCLRAQAEVFKTTQVEIYRANVPQQLKVPPKPFDIVFLDPPFQQDLLLPTCFFLEQNHFLNEKAYIYLEAKTMIEENNLPPNWQLIKNKRAGQVAYHLVLRKQGRSI